MPRATVAHDGHRALAGGRFRIIRLLKASIVQVVGRNWAKARIQDGSKSSGHQHPPIADIAIATTAPKGITESWVRAIHAMMRPKAAAANEIAAAGNSSIAGFLPNDTPNIENPIANSTTIWSIPTRKRASSLPIRVPVN